jgi:hypothetical protein
MQLHVISEQKPPWCVIQRRSVPGTQGWYSNYGNQKHRTDNDVLCHYRHMSAAIGAQIIECSLGTAAAAAAALAPSTWHSCQARLPASAGTQGSAAGGHHQQQQQQQLMHNSHLELFYSSQCTRQCAVHTKHASTADQCSSVAIPALAFT